MDWDDARGVDATARTQINALFAARYPMLYVQRQTEITTALDLAAYFDVPTSSAFSATDRPLAICHMAAHNLESSPTSGAPGGRPKTGETNERGSTSYAPSPVSEYLSPVDRMLEQTNGGANYLRLRASLPATLPRVR